MHNNFELVISTLDKLLPQPGAILLFDQGFKYTHKIYQEYFGKLQLQGSHSRKRNCLDNICVESFFSHLKTEVFAGRPIVNKDKTGCFGGRTHSFLQYRKVSEKAQPAFHCGVSGKVGRAVYARWGLFTCLLDRGQTKAGRLDY